MTGKTNDSYTSVPDTDPNRESSKKKLNFYFFSWLLYDFLFLKNDANVPSKSNEPKKMDFFASWRLLTKRAGSGSDSQRYGSADPDPYKLSQIRNTGIDPEFFFIYTVRIHISFVDGPIQRLVLRVTVCQAAAVIVKTLRGHWDWLLKSLFVYCRN